MTFVVNSNGLHILGILFIGFLIAFPGYSQENIEQKTRQAGYERNWRAEMEMGENRYPAAWTSSALVELTWEYGIGKKAKASVGVFYDFLYKQHAQETNAVLWRMGWKL